MRRMALSHAVRQRLVRLPEPFQAHYGVIPAHPPIYGINLGEGGPHAAAVLALQEAVEIQRGLPDGYLVTRLLARKEAVSSSAIEGTQSTLDELLLSEEVNEAGTLATEQVRDYARVLDEHLPRFAQNGPAEFHLAEFLALHRGVMAADPDYRGHPGELRARVVWIGGGDISTSTFNPPPPSEVEACLVETAEYLRGDLGQHLSQSLLTRMAIGHAHFEAVHPFQDGNGRVGRLLWPLMMAAEGLPPLYLSPYVEANKSAYYDALKAAQQREDWGRIVSFVSEAVVGTVAALKTTLSDLERLEMTWRARLSPRRGSAAERAMPLLTHYPVVTVKRLETLLDVSTPSANAAVSQLVAGGILREQTGYRRNRVFVAAEALHVLNRPFSVV